MKTLYYKYEGNYIKFKSNYFNDKNDYNNKKITQAIKLSLRKKFNISIQDYCVKEHNLLIEKCGFCNNYSFIELKYNFTKFKRSHIINIKDVSYPSNFYCKEKGCIGKKINPNSIEFVSKTRRINKKQAIEIIHDRNNSPFYLENHKNKNEYKKYQSLKYRLSNKEYEKFIENLKYSKTINYYIEKYGEEGIKIWEEINSKKDSMSFLYFLKKNNYDYKKSILEYKNRVKSVLPKNISYMGGSYSEQSYNIFKKIVKDLKLKNYMFGENELFLEYYDTDNNKRKFFYDFVDLNNNIIIEYNGLRWHPNKEKMSTEQYNNWYHPFDNTISKNDLEEKDKIKKKIALNNNFKFLTIWDSNTDKENIDIIKNFYKNT